MGDLGSMTFRQGRGSRVNDHLEENPDSTSPRDTGSWVLDLPGIFSTGDLRCRLHRGIRSPGSPTDV